MSRMAHKPKVSVCVVTYNQEAYVRQCLQSTVDQIANFEFEIIVGDDCSTDQTRQVILEFQDRYPDLIKPLFQAKNLGAVRNYFATHTEALGDYIAHLDGDDYFLPGKLQKQADFLDLNPEFNIVWHRVRYEFQDGQLRDDNIHFDKIRNGFGRAELIKFSFLANHSSKMYRACQRQYCNQIENTLDYFLNIEHLQAGRAGYVSDEILGVYRYGLGVSSSPNLRFRRYLINGLRDILTRHPEDRPSIHLVALPILIADIRAKNITFPGALALWLRSFSFTAVIGYPDYLRARAMYALPKP